MLQRRGAELVPGVDVMECSAKVDVVQYYTKAYLDYHGGLTHGQTVSFLRERYGGNFDLVIFLGVLYHCLAPLHALGMARSLVRTGGVMIVETLAALDKQQAMFFNTMGMISADPSTFFTMSVPLFEYFLRSS
jgi:2-polyprenyl-3-methyl-5-hydroxy-6-metoxy-1,4-benzoquinol methylase